MIHTVIMNDVLAGIFVLGLLLVYLPQFYKIIKAKTSYGFNQWFMWMGYVASLVSWLNALLFYIDNWWACDGARNCVEGLLGFFLIFFQWLLYLAQYILFIYYHPRIQVESQYGILDNLETRPNRQIRIWFWIANVFGAICLMITLALLGVHHWRFNADQGLKIWGIVMEVIIMAMFLFHYLPQIYETLKLKRVGSLSLVTLALICVGTFLWTAFLAVQKDALGRSGTSRASVWAPYLVVGSMQFVLLVVGIYYEHQRESYLNRLKDFGERTKVSLSGFSDDDQKEEEAFFIEEIIQVN